MTGGYDHTSYPLVALFFTFQLYSRAILYSYLKEKKKLILIWIIAKKKDVKYTIIFYLM